MYVNKEEISRAKSIDLLTYLMTYELDNLVKISRGNYCTVDHDSLKISNGKWHWFSRQIGGTNVISYLTNVYGYSFPEAVKKINGNLNAKEPVQTKQEYTKRKYFQLPEKADKPLAAIEYLRKRCIDDSLIAYCLYDGILYEEKNHHNVVFLGKDPEGNVKYACMRGTTEKKFHGEVSCSNKNFSFSLGLNNSNDVLHVFESPIDLLSYGTLLKHKKHEWNKQNYLSLGGVYDSNKDTNPIALETFLNNHKNIKNIILHLDNDHAGRAATELIKRVYSNKYNVLDRPPTSGKDVNEYLVKYMNKERGDNNARWFCISL
ncbi:DUF3991 domain-containing protein [Mycoplasma sp. P36-A1]